MPVLSTVAAACARAWGFTAGDLFAGAALALDFDETTTLDSRITFTRATSATYFDSSGVLQTASSGVARFDHRLEGGVWVNKGLLIEEQRTNVNLQSEALSNATYWTPIRGSVSADATTAPDGNSTADKFVEDSTATNSHFILPAVAYRPTLTANTTYTLSVFAKAGERTQFAIYGTGAASWNPTTPNGQFDLSTGTVIGTSGATATIEDCGNGWYRCSIVATLGASSGSATLQFNLMDNGSLVYTGDGSSGMYFWGAQLESGAFPTSYIKTTTASVTRNADVAVMTSTDFSSWYNATEGTTFWQGQVTSNVGANKLAYAISDNTTSERIFLTFQDANNETSGMNVYDGGSIVAALNSPNPRAAIIANQTYKHGFAYKVDDFAATLDGISPSTDTSGTLPTVDRLYFGSQYDGASLFLNGHIAKFYYWNTRKSNNFLTSITS